MTPEQRRRLEEPDHSARDREPGERNAFLLAPGERLGQYEIAEPLGQGGMGTVYRASDTKLGRFVALKLLRPEMLDDSLARARFEREARTLASLNHPNIATIYGFEEHNGAHFLALEYVPGETLAERLQRGPLPVREALLISKQIAEALEAAHAQGIVHRDLKPANIKLTGNGQVKVLDFGLAKPVARRVGPEDTTVLFNELTQSMTIVGTPAYMSPEQVRGMDLDARADIWSFGCVLYESLTAKRPFTGSVVTEIFAAVLEREPDWAALPPTVPDRLTALLKRCLRKELTGRLRDLGDARLELEDLLAAPLESASAPRPVETAQPTLIPALPRKRTRPGWLVPAAIAAALSVAVSVGYWQLSRRDYFWKNPLEGAQFTKLTDWPGIELDASISPDGKFVAFLANRDGLFDAWVTQLGSGDFHNLTGGKSVALLHEMARTTGFNADSTQVWIRTPTATLERTNFLGVGPPSLSLVPTMGGSLRPFLEPATLNPVWTTDGMHLAFHHSDPGDPIMIAGPDGRGEKQLLRARPGEHEHYLTWSPDQRWIYYMRCWRTTEADIWRVPVAGGAPEQITHNHSYVGYPVLLDNRTLVYRASKEDGSGWVLYAMDVEHRIAHQVSQGVEEYQSVSASADGRRLVVTTSNPIANLWKIPITAGIAEESAAERLPIPDAHASYGQYGDGGVLYVSGKGGAGGLQKWMNGSVTSLWPASAGRLPYGASLSPDKKRLAFAVRQNRRNVLYLSNADGTDAHSLSAQLDVLTTPSWSPDSAWITASADSGEGPRIYKVSVNGGDPVRLTEAVSFNSVWSPAGDRIVFYDGNVGGATFPLRSVSPGKSAMPMPNISYRGDWQGYRFMPDGKSMVVLQGQFRAMDFWLLNLETGARRRLTNLKAGYSIRNLDISPDGKEILFDRLQENSDIALIDRK